MCLYFKVILEMSESDKFRMLIEWGPSERGGGVISLFASSGLCRPGGGIMYQTVQCIPKREEHSFPTKDLCNCTQPKN